MLSNVRISDSARIVEAFLNENVGEYFTESEIENHTGTHVSMLMVCAAKLAVRRGKTYTSVLTTPTKGVSNSRNSNYEQLHLDLKEDIPFDSNKIIKELLNGRLKRLSLDNGTASIILLYLVSIYKKDKAVTSFEEIEKKLGLQLEKIKLGLRLLRDKGCIRNTKKEEGNSFSYVIDKKVEEDIYEGNVERDISILVNNWLNRSYTLNVPVSACLVMAHLLRYYNFNSKCIETSSSMHSFATGLSEKVGLSPNCIKSKIAELIKMKIIETRHEKAFSKGEARTYKVPENIIELIL